MKDKMENLNYKFFEEYKHLDKLCGEIYNTNHGITEYINDMKAVPSIKCNCIQDWKSDLEQLKRVRYIRNNLAHAEYSFNIDECTQKDIDFVTGFYNRILNQTDPLSLLHQSYSEKNHISNKVYAQKRQVEIQANMRAEKLVTPSEGYVCKIETQVQPKVQTEKPVNNNIYNQTNEDMEKSVINSIFAVFAIIIIVTLITLFIVL